MRKYITLCSFILAGNMFLSAVEPRVDMPPSWTSDSIFTTIEYGDNASWWQTFDDPVLDSLISLGETNNYNLVAAAKRIDIARSQLRAVRGSYAPTIGINAGYTRERQSGLMTGRSGEASTMSYFTGAATMSWEIDIFGKIRAQARHADKYVKVTAAEYAAAMVALDAEIASTYINLLVEKQQLEVAHEHTENQAHILEITEVRYRTGLASKLDVAQARTLYYSTIASIPLLEASIEASYNALGVLTGLGREGLPQAVFSTDKLPDHYQLAALGAPLDILRRRPDIVEAERNIDLAAAELGIARSAYLPSLSLSASVGTMAHNFGDLFKGPSFTYSIVPTLSWTLFDGLQRRNTALAARQSMEARIDSYNLTVLTAIEEVRDAIARYKSSLLYIERIGNVVTSSEEEVQLSIDQYKQGLTMFSNVVDAQLNYLTYQNTLISARGDAISSLISLYKALGGGWTE